MGQKRFMITVAVALLSIALSAGAEAPRPIPSAEPPSLLGYQLGKRYVLEPSAWLEPDKQIYQRVMLPKTTISLAGVQSLLQINLQVTLQTNTIVAVFAQIPVSSAAAARQIKDALLTNWRAKYGEDSIGYLADKQTGHIYSIPSPNQANLNSRILPL